LWQQPLKKGVFMIKSFSVPSANVQEFVGKVSQAMEGRDLGKIVSLKVEGQVLTVVFSKLGTSQVVFDIANQGGGFECVHKSEKIAIAHKALRSDIEGKLAKVLESQGAQIKQD
jgi:hypothetical protein